MSSDGVAYGPSAFGHTVVTAEPPLSSIRHGMIVVQLAMGAAMLLHTAALVLARRRGAGPLPPVVWGVSVAYALSVITHTWHYADNIYRPVDYFEPKWLYDALLVTAMDKTFLFGFPMAALAVVGIQRVLAPTTATAATTATAGAPDAATASASTDVASARRVLRGCQLLAIYSALSSISGAHYNVHPPWEYTASVNGSIATETVCAFALMALCGWLGSAMRTAAKLKTSDAPTAADAAPAATGGGGDTEMAGLLGGRA